MNKCCFWRDQICNYLKAAALPYQASDCAGPLEGTGVFAEIWQDELGHRVFFPDLLIVVSSSGSLSCKAACNNSLLHKSFIIIHYRASWCSNRAAVKRVCVVSCMSSVKHFRDCFSNLTG